MPGFFGLTKDDICSHTALPNPAGSTKTNLLTAAELEWQKYGYLFSSVHLNTSPLSGPRLYNDTNWIGLFSGDLVDYMEIPWEELTAAVDSRNPEIFSTLNGRWAVAIINRRNSTLHLISDRCCQHPLYYYIDNKQLRFSTDLSAFCRTSSASSFNVDWLYELLFFHFPIGDTTFLTDVKRIPAASILEYSFRSAEFSLRTYCKPFEVQPSKLATEETLTRSLEVFSSRVPVYAPTESPWAAAVTGGWDARTILAFSMEKNPVSYTYGIPGCGDLVATRNDARKLGIEHREVLLDQAFTNQLSNLMFETVFLSDGLENCFRSSLIHVYRTLTGNGETFPVVLSGIGLDSMFRGHLGPALVSPDMKRIFKGGSTEPDALWAPMIKDYSQFRSHNNEKTLSLLAQLGEPGSGATHLLYFLYEIAPKYYGGELNVARHFTSLRTPALDHDIIQLSLSTHLSTLSFSNFLSTHKRGDYTEEILQAYLLSNSPSPKFGSLPICGVPPFALLHGRLTYNALKFLFKIRGRLLRLKSNYRISAPLERNVEWYSSILQTEIQNLLYSDETRITSYLRLPPLAELATVDNQHLFKKLLTAEIIIRLTENGWQKFW